MNTAFNATLKNIRETRHEKDNDNAVSHLEDHLIVIQSTLRKYSPETSNSLRNWADRSYIQITKERSRIKKYLQYWQMKEIIGLSAYDVEEIDEEITHFSEILNLIDDARTNLVEHLIVLHPTEYSKNEIYIDAVKELLPDHKKDVLQFQETNDSELKTASTDVNYRIEPTFDSDCIIAVSKYVGSRFKKQENEFLNLIKDGAPPCKKLIFSGKATELACTFSYLLSIQRITGVQKTELEDWIVSNFQYKSKDKICDFKKEYLQKFISRQSTNNGERNDTRLITIHNGEFVPTVLSQKRTKS